MAIRSLVGFLVCCMVVIGLSESAYAVNSSASIADPVVDSNIGSPGDYVVYPVSNRFDATLVLLGMWHTKIMINQEMFVKLSNESSGGAFYELASKFLDGNDPPPWADPMNDVIGSFFWNETVWWVNSYVTSPGEDYVWWVNAQADEIAAAKRDLNVILNGGSLGSPGGGAVGDYYEYTLYCNYQTGGWITFPSRSTWNKVKSDGSAADGNYGLTANALTVRLPKDFVDGYVTRLGSGYSVEKSVVQFSRTGSSESGNLIVGFYLSNSPLQLRSSTIGTLNFDYYVPSGTPVVDRYFSVTDSSFAFESGVLTADYFVGKQNSVSVSWNYTLSGYSYQQYGLPSGGSGGSGGDNHWPEPVTPPPPDPPETEPEPDPDPPDPGPGIDLPDVDFPDITIESPSTSVSFPTINIESPSTTVNPPSNTNPTDYTPWLSAILDALNSIIADLDSHCQHLRQAIKTYSEALGNSINVSLDSHCQHLRQAIKTYSEALASSIHDDLEYFYNDLTAYLAELAQWLVDHLNWSVDVQSPDVTVPSFDDSGIVAWLKRIYLKMGGTKMPKPDPVSNPGDALDWWSALLQWIANALSGFITTFVGDVGAVVEGVLTRFPFSIPWDILAYLTLLDAERVTPVIVVTVPAVTGWWSQFSVTIDLSAYNLAMATVRSMMLVWWGFVLVMRTDWILLVMGRTGAELATGFVSRLVGNGGD